MVCGKVEIFSVYSALLACCGKFPGCWNFKMSSTSFKTAGYFALYAEIKEKVNWGTAQSELSLALWDFLKHDFSLCITHTHTHSSPPCLLLHLSVPTHTAVSHRAWAPQQPGWLEELGLQILRCWERRRERVCVRVHVPGRTPAVMVPRVCVTVLTATVILSNSGDFLSVQMVWAVRGKVSNSSTESRLTQSTLHTHSYTVPVQEGSNNNSSSSWAWGQLELVCERDLSCSWLIDLSLKRIRCLGITTHPSCEIQQGCSFERWVRSVNLLTLCYDYENAVSKTDTLLLFIYISVITGILHLRLQHSKYGMWFCFGTFLKRHRWVNGSLKWFIVWSSYTCGDCHVEQWKRQMHDFWAAVNLCINAQNCL